MQKIYKSKNGGLTDTGLLRTTGGGWGAWDLSTAKMEWGSRKGDNEQERCCWRKMMCAVYYAKLHFREGGSFKKTKAGGDTWGGMNTRGEPLGWEVGGKVGGGNSKSLRLHVFSPIRVVVTF